MALILRRRKLGRTSCREIARQSTTGIQVCRNDKDIPNAGLVFRWGCTTDVPGDPEVVNSAAAIHRVTDKLAFRKVLDEAELCPKTWFQLEDLHYPCVIRPARHHQGRHLYVCEDRYAAINASIVCTAAAGGWYGSELIAKQAEYRVFVVGGRVVNVARKFPKDPAQVAWNVFQGGHFEAARWGEWPLKAIRLSLEAFTLSKLDFGGVDVMVKDKEAYILEINAAPSLTSPYNQSCFARGFDWIVQNGKQHIPLIQTPGGYKKFIHPAVCKEAILV